MIRQVVFVVEAPLSARDEERFGLRLLADNGFDVVVWDVTYLVHPALRGKLSLSQPSRWPGLRTFDRRDDAERAMRALGSDSFVICLVGYDLPSCWVYRAVSASRAGYGVELLGGQPPPAGGDESAPPLWRRVAALTPRKLAGSLLVRVPRRWLGVRPAGLALVGGAKFSVGVAPVDRTTEIVSAHMMDYDLFLRLRSEALGGAGGAKRGVFLDQNLPFHPDFLYQGRSSPVAPERYFPLMRSFFDRLEARFGARITIAAHPRAAYAGKEDSFGSREIVYGRAAELVRDSDFAITHYSTAIALAVLFEKPLIFAGLDRAMSPGRRQQERQAALLGTRIIELDAPEADWASLLNVDRRAYAAYRHDYLKEDGTPERPLWQILADRLKKAGAPA